MHGNIDGGEEEIQALHPLIIIKTLDFLIEHLEGTLVLVEQVRNYLTIHNRHYSDLI